MNPPPDTAFAFRQPAATHLHPRPVPLTPVHHVTHHQPQQLVAMPAQQLPARTHGRTETDVQWIVGWVRDLLVIAMAIANLMHLGGGH